MIVTEKSSFEMIRSDHLPEPLLFLSSSTRIERLSLLRTKGETIVMTQLLLILPFRGQCKPLGLEDRLGGPGGHLGLLARRATHQVVERLAQRVPEGGPVARQLRRRDNRRGLHVLAVRL